jgi:hypothetical protein
VQGTMDGGLAAELNVDSWRRCRSRWRSCGMMTAQVKHLATLVAGMPEMQTAWWGWGRWCGVRRVSWPGSVRLR